MAFPDSQRVLYAKNPLELVICQLRFPAILRVETEAPAEFQERVRSEYPFFQEKHAVAIEQHLPKQLAERISAELRIGAGRSTYEFTSADGAWTVALTKDFLALTSRKYQRWEEFRERLRTALDALLADYSPTFFTRIGLRYRDVVRRSGLGLGDLPWSALLNPYIAAELSSTDIAADIEQAAREFVLRLDNDSLVRVQHGLAQSPESQETSYVIDADFFTEQRTETDRAIEILNEFNRHAGRLFRWCITLRLHESLEPCPI